ncbi:CheR family methyltransferase [Rhodocista pekingensis]|uniref:CheR family methyltransferase n=1 Tax=Rhodocista pekingensis TaxID=201185 RepID=A0ABW2KXJ2_9PROT
MAQRSRSPSGHPTVIAVVGASAGGLEALQALFGGMPVEIDIAFLVVQHRLPGHESLLVDLIARRTGLPVIEGADGMVLSPGHVVLAPAGLPTWIENGHLRVGAAPEPDRIALPIDRILRSLAESCGEAGIAVILSGAGHDGALGVRAVKEAGGLIIAQEPGTAGMDLMPRAAIDTGCVDLILPPDRIGAALLDYVAHPYVAGGAEAGSGGVETQRILDQIVGLLLTKTRISFRDYKRRTLARRIERRMGICRIATMAAYLHHLRTSPGEPAALVQDLLISVTRFFRDQASFEALRQDVIVPMVAVHDRDAPIRVWVPGCATGEEAYSIAMLLTEAGAGSAEGPDFKIFASDIDERALDLARTGRYPETGAADLPPGFLDRYFEQESGGIRVNDRLRSHIVFARQDLLADPPFSQLDLISCRNLLIYAEPEAQKRLIPLFHFTLNRDGFLFLGSAETTAGRGDLFDPVSAKHRIFRRLGGQRGRTLPPGNPAGEIAGPARMERMMAEPARHGPEMMRQALMGEFVPPSVLVDSKGQIRFIHGNLQDILVIPPGEPRIDLLAMTSGDLRVQLRDALRKASTEKRKIVVGDVRPGRDSTAGSLRLSVIPIQAGRRLPEPHFVVIFQPEGRAADPPPVPADQEPLVARLEHELKVTRADLESTIQELESSNEALLTANEEITTINEEMQSTNEELETSKEELQSLNEELSTVNAQLQEKIEELEATSNDLTNLLNSTAIPTVFLDSEQRIRRFTPAAVKLFTLIPGDIGRPFTDVSRRFDDPTLLADVDAVLDKLHPAEAQVEATDGAMLLRRILPYRTQQNRIEGVVITFTDVTASIRANQQVAARARQQTIVADLSQRALAGMPAPDLFAETAAAVAAVLEVDSAAILKAGQDGRIRRLAQAGTRAADLPGGDVTADPLSDIGQAVATRLAVRVGDFLNEPSLRPTTDHDRIGSRSSVVIPFSGPPPTLLAVHDHRPDRFGDDDQNFLLSIANMLGLAMERERAEQETRSARDLAQDVIDTQRLPSLLLNEAGEIVSANAAYHLRFGTVADTVIQRRPADTCPELWQGPRLADAIRSVQNGGPAVLGLEIAHDQPDGRSTCFQVDVQRLGRTPSMIVITIDDITLTRLASEELSRAKRAAEQASAAKSRFLAAASHDLRQPLQGAVLFHSLAVGRNDNGEVEKYLDLLGSTLTVLQEMMETLLDISRLDAGIIESAVEPTPLDPILADLAAEYAPQAVAAGLRLRCVPSGLAGLTDPKLLSRILRNLITNALRYTGKGGIVVGCRRRGNAVHLQVWDSGSGIPTDQLEAIFDEFHQVQNAARERQRGLGLGLAIVRRLSDLLGHKVRVRSVLGRGSVFEVILRRAAVPAARSPARPAALPVVPPMTGPDRPCILVIEDDPIVLDAMTQALRDAGLDVRSGLDLETVVARLGKDDAGSVGCILSDYMLPGALSGIETVDLLRQRLGRNIPAILLTGDTSPDRLKEARTSGLVVMHKPVKLPDLLGAIRTIMAPDSPPATRDSATAETGGAVEAMADQVGPAAARDA